MGELNDIKWGVIFCVGELVVGKLVCGRIHRNSRDLSKYRRPLLWNCVNKMMMSNDAYEINLKNHMNRVMK